MKGKISLSALFLCFAQVGLFTFGGGMAMLPILEREVVERRHWATETELANYFAIGQCTPGIIAVNTATFVGQRLRGILGGLAATAGVVTPSLLIITFLAGVIARYQNLDWVQNAFAGVQVCVCVLIFNAMLRLWRSSVVDGFTALLFLLVLLGSLFLNLSPVLFVLLAAGLGVAWKNWEVHRR